MSDTSNDKQPMSDAERRRKSNAKRVFLRTGVVRDDYAADHPVKQMVAKYESLKGRTKSDWMLDLLLVGYELDQMGLAEGLATMIRNRTVDSAGGVLVAAERLHQLHSGLKAMAAKPVAEAITNQQEPQMPDIPKMIPDQEPEGLSQDDIDMGFG